MRGKKQLTVIIATIIIALVATVIIFFLGKPDANVPERSFYKDPNAIIKAGDNNSFAAISENAWFYYDEHLVKYYDPYLKKSFILCSRSNCLHDSEKCEAYFGYDIFGESAIEGVVAEDNYVYVLSSGETDGFDRESPIPFQIVRIDPSDGTRKVIAEFNNSIYAQPCDGKEYLSSIDSTRMYVCNGMLWLRDSMMIIPGETLDDYPLQWYTNIGINLKTGELTYIGEKDFDCKILTMGSGYVTYVHDEYDETVLTREEFYDLLTDNGRVEYNGSSYNDYSTYLDAIKLAGFRSKYYIYHLDDGTTKELFESRSVKCQSIANQSISFITSQRTIFGSHDDLVLIKEYLPDENDEYSLKHFHALLYSTKDGSAQQFFETENGHMPSTMIDGLNGILADGSVIIYQYSENGAKTEDWVYNVETKELKYIYTKEDIGYSFRPEGIWNGGFIGNVYQLNGLPEGAHDDYYPMSYAWISREDYLNGNVKNLVWYKIK